MNGLRLVLLALAIAASALAAGFFFAWDAVVMPGFAAAEPETAVGAMQAVNASVRNPLFAASFFGSAVFGLLAAASLWGRGPAFALAVAGAAVYGVGVLTVTFLIHVPLNEGLAPLRPPPDEAAVLWDAYSSPWEAWNPVRTLGALAACALYVGALVRWRVASSGGAWESRKASTL